MNLDKFLGCIYGVAIGDALGRPVETMNACEIRNKFKRIEKYERFHNHSTGERYNPGTWSDDTQLTLALMEAFIKSDCSFDMDIIAECHKTAFRNAKGRGWGPSTRKACKNLAKGAHWSESGSPNGAGNGVMMKIAPYALLRSVLWASPKKFMEECVRLAKMTHLGTPAIVGGVVHAFAIASLAGHNERPIHVPTFLYFLYKVAVEVEEQLPSWEDRISDQISRIIQYGVNGRLGTAELETIAAWFGGGTSYAHNSFGLSYAIFTRGCLNYDIQDSFNAVFDAVNAGGDTDSNAAIVGSLVGALHGMRVIPKDLVRDVEESSEILKLTTKFYYLCDKLRQTKSSY